ncbi:MAG TPA: hypothetical protein VLJ39_04585 [Tepidisphaeraceae bacterium]|nr:hypothetical protein [Tepidisphaeraceae bacterium]
MPANTSDRGNPPHCDPVPEDIMKLDELREATREGFAAIDRGE